MERRRRLTDYWADALRDLRFTLRTLGRDPGFAVISILILALAIGGNIAVFAVVNTLLLRPLPFPDAHELVWIAPPPSKCGFLAPPIRSMPTTNSAPAAALIRMSPATIAFSSPDNLSLTSDAPTLATSIDVIANFFQVLGVQPAMGRISQPTSAQRRSSCTVLANAYGGVSSTPTPTSLARPST